MERTKRKLTAILSADVKGYSRLMGEDESATVRTIESYRSAMGKLINKYRGRVVDSPGDNVLAEFGSVVDAIECGVEIQNELKSKNAELPENRRMEFRIGINLGDVIEEGERIYGDGVNIAARLEGLAEGGGICISRAAFDQVKNKLNLGYEYLGEHSVKNIAEPVRVYRVLMEPEDAGKIIGEEKPKQWRLAIISVAVVLVLFAGGLTIWNFFLKPSPPSRDAVSKNMSIAVLPFTNMSQDPEQEYFSDGMTDDLITDLSKISGLFVIARNSVFTYKGVTKKIGEIAKELGVRYILEGSVRRAEAKVRINAQLIDSTTGGHLWAERYDRDFKNIFALQDEIVKNITSALAVKLTKGEKAQLAKKYTDNLEAYDYYLRGMQAMYRKQYEGTFKDPYQGFIEAKSLFEKAIGLDPEFGKAYVSRALVNYFALENDLAIANLSGSHAEALKYISKALTVDSSLPMAHSIIAGLQALEGHYEEAILSAEKAITLDPNNADSYLILAYILTQSGRHEEALESINNAFQLNPKPPSAYYDYLGYIQFNNRQYVNAIESFKKAGGITGFLYSYTLVACYAHLGRLEEAKAAFDDLEHVEAGMSLAALDRFALRLKNEEDRKHYIEGFRKAGVPEFSYGFEGDKANMLSTDEIQTLLVGRIQTGYSPVADIDKNRNPQWWMHYRDDETCNISGFWEDSCVYRIEDNRLYVKYSEMNDAKWFWWQFFRNPDGTAKELNEYVAVGKIILPFSVQ